MCSQRHHDRSRSQRRNNRLEVLADKEAAAWRARDVNRLHRRERRQSLTDRGESVQQRQLRASGITQISARSDWGYESVSQDCDLPVDSSRLAHSVDQLWVITRLFVGLFYGKKFSV